MSTAQDDLEVREILVDAHSKLAVILGLDKSDVPEAKILGTDWTVFQVPSATTPRYAHFVVGTEQLGWLCSCLGFQAHKKCYHVRAVEGAVKNTSLRRRGKQPLGEAYRFWPKVEFPEKRSGCWTWKGTVSRAGYGTFLVGSAADGTRKQVYAHRWAYREAYGINPEEQLDHICHNRDKGCPGGNRCPHRRCVRPDHLREAIHAENLHASHAVHEGPWKRKTHCSKGHPYDEANTYVSKSGRRFCRECARANSRRQTERRKRERAARRNRVRHAR